MNPSRIFALVLLILVSLSLVVGLTDAVLDTPKPVKPTAATGGTDPLLAQGGKLLSAMNPQLVAVELRGPITSAPEQSGFFNNDSAAVRTRKALDELAEDNRVKGVLLVIDSPGGTVAMSQELNAAVQRVSAKKPVVATLGDVAASGGYYTAVAADRIVANPGTLTASIGVIIQTFNAQELMNDKLGIQGVTIKSGRFKDLLNPLRPTDPAERELIQTIVDRSYDQFLAAVLEGRVSHIGNARQRQQLSERIQSVADGRIVLGSQAVELGLVDELGDRTHAEQVLNQLVVERFKLPKTTKLPVVDYQETPNFFNLFGFPIMAQMAQWTGLPAGSVQGAQLQEQVLPFSLRYPNQPLWIME